MGHVHEVEMFIFNLQFDFSVLPMGRSSNGEDSLTEESLKTMSRYRKITTICCAAVFALGLSACGGGDDGISVADRDAAVNDAVDAEKAKTEALQMQIDALRAQLELEDDGNVGDSVAALQAEVTRLEGLIDAAEKAKEAEDMKAMTATAKKLKTAIGDTPLARLQAVPTITKAGLMVQAVGDVNAVTLKTGEAGGSMGDWMGMSYARMDTVTKMADEAMVYTNRGMATDQKAAAALGNVAGYAPATRTVEFSDTDPDSDIAGDSFPTALTKTFDLKGAPSISFSGSYKGVPGTYHCVAGDAMCKARNEGSDGIALTDGGWTFVHAEGATASKPDEKYLQFGWWVRKGSDGEPMMASAFFGGTVANPQVDYADLGGGSATYTGMAIGKYAMTETKTDSAEGGHFTADVTLTAKFGDDDDAGIKGMIENFMAGDESKDWSVELKRAGWDDGGAFGSSTAMTAWSINGNAAADSGSWSGRMYDEAEDDSDVPTTAIGSFQSHYGESGRMVGAFGANKQ